ncbi:hypothetical protein VFPPC_16467 [Pochonia chlamydosporia 170]|uniref:Uncharacterized protein n=1 Tax=Pochonia chlamydosporia 170 TaxID=1380566 RepID=A0A179FD14_METCM|nr:hypothetical protein VFPPC_16467 [Pochonia chlamydosporia 170]OAQ63394.2 hypothetical protein VFPPC_16467 [Pochonia chlamydosporia 170]
MICMPRRMVSLAQQAQAPDDRNFNVRHPERRDLLQPVPKVAVDRSGEYSGCYCTVWSIKFVGGVARIRQM